MKQIKTLYGTPFAIDDLVNEEIANTPGMNKDNIQILMSSSADKSGVNALPDVVVTIVYDLEVKE